MPQFQIRCPQCQQQVRMSVSDQQASVQLPCPHCNAEIKFRVPRPASPKAQVAAPSQANSDPLNIYAPGNPKTNPVRPQGQRTTTSYQSAGNPYSQTTRNSGNSKLIFLLAGIGFATLLLVGGVIAGLYFLLSSSGEPSLNAEQGKVASAESQKESKLPVSANPLPKIPRPESAALIRKELEKLREQAERSVEQVTDADRHTTGADRLMEFVPQFEALFLRAVQAEPESLNLDDVARNDGNLADSLANAQQSGVSNQPGPNYIWTLNSTNDPANRWGTAAYAVSSAKLRADVALQSRVRLPDPLKETSDTFGWTAEDRRVLSAYWLQGDLEREVQSELMACIREKATVQRMYERCFPVIERFYDPARQLAAVKSAQGNMLIREPRRSPYFRHAAATRRTLEELLKEFPDESVAWIINQTIAFSDVIEDLQFGRTEGVKQFTNYRVQQRYDADQSAKDEQLKKLAEEERIKREQAKAEEIKVARAEADKQKKQKQEAEAKEASDKELSQKSVGSAKDGEPGIRGPRPFGSGSGRPPFDPGRSLDQPPGAGDRDEAAAGSRPGFGPPRGFGDSRPPSGPPPGPPKMGTSVTIRIQGPTDMKVGEFLDKLKRELKTENFEMSHSGGEAKIVLGFAGDLQKVVDAIDFGKAVIADEQKREISVTID